MINRCVAIHPFLFALLVPLIIYCQNMGNIPAGQLILPILVVAALTAVIWLLIDLMFRNRTASALIVSPLMVVLLSYGQTFNYVKSGAPTALIEYIRLTILTIAAVSAFAAYFYLVFRHRNSNAVAPANKILNIVGACMIAFNLYQAAKVIKKTSVETVPTAQAVSLNAGSERPDIYFIVLDQFAGLREIKDVFHYDNGSFGRWMTEKGFYIAEKSRSRYIWTAPSLACTLNMAFRQVETSRDINNSDPEKEALANTLIRGNMVMSMLKSYGYKYVNFGSWFYYTSYNKNADINVNCYGLRSKSEYAFLLLRSSLAGPLMFMNRQMHRDDIIYEFNEVGKTVSLQGPKFVFAHVLCPHYPFVFGPDGEKVTAYGVDKSSNKSIYLGQYIYTVKLAEKLVTDILANSKTPPIIIIESDHGSKMDPAYSRDILNAVYFPGKSSRIFYETLSPHNTFRLLFNEYFGANFPLLDDAPPLQNKKAA